MRYILIVLICLTFQSCALINVTQKHFKTKDEPAPKEKLLSFESQEAMKVGATLNNNTAAKVFYKGAAPESEDAKILYDLSYRFLAFIGVNNSFDPTDPEALKNAFKAADAAVQEKDRNLAELRVAVDDYRTKLEGEKKIVKDKEAEMRSQDGKFSAKLGAVWWWFWFLVILVFVGAFLIQMYSGLPVFTGLLTGSLRTIKKTISQTVASVEDVRNGLKATAASEHATKEEKDYATKTLQTMSTMMNNHQDEDVRKFISKVKTAPEVVRNLFNHNKDERNNNGRPL